MTNAPNVTFFIVINSLKNLRRHIPSRSVSADQILIFGADDLSETKVDDFDLVFSIDQNVLWLDISMADVNIVAIVDCLHYSLHDVADIVFIKFFLVVGSVQELNAVKIFSNDVKVCFILKKFKNTQYIRVRAFPKHPHL